MKRVEFLCGDLILKGVFFVPEGDGPFGLVVVCHPHPLYGGNMYDRVVHEVCEKIAQESLAWLKFNFRGVGGSGGRFGGGIGEKEDAGAAISFGSAQGKINPDRVGICGYSFGSGVALATAVEDPRVKAAAAISPFVHPPGLLDHYTRPKLFLCGTRDEFIDTRELEQWVRKLPEPKEWVLYPGIDHFWSGSIEEMAQRVGRYFKENL